MKTDARKLLIALILSVCLAGFAKADLAKQIDGITGKSSQNKVRFSIHILKADTGETVYAHDANSAMVPASNMKVVITAAALKYLGPDYKYKTKVGLCGDSLAVIGSGDPLLGDESTDTKYGRKSGWIFEDIAATLKKSGVADIKDIIVDAGIFDNQRVHPNWPKEQLNFWYACEVSGLNFNDNCVKVSAKTVDGRAVVQIEPQSSFLDITNKVVAVQGGKSTVGSYRQPEPNKIVVYGKCRERAGPFDVAIEQPAMFFATLLSENLGKSGIKVNGRVVEKPIDPNCNFRMLAEYSTPLADCLERANKNSLGLAAEGLLKTIAANARADKKNGGWAEGRGIVSQYLLTLGVERSEFNIDDGSGLSRENRLSANALTAVLLDVYRSQNRQLYKDSLAEGGVEGTIGRYFKEEKYKGKIFGKTGYIEKVKSFSGVCNTKKGDYIFSILANNANDRSREAINNIAKAIVDEAEKQEQTK